MLFVQTAKNALLVVSALFPIVDPIGGAPVFLSLTLNYDRDTRRLLARRIAMHVARWGFPVERSESRVSRREESINVQARTDRLEAQRRRFASCRSFLPR